MLDIHNYGFGPIHHAAKSGDNEEILRLVSEGVDVDTEINFVKDQGPYSHRDNYGYTPLHIAFLANRINTARLLIDLGSDPYRVNGIDTWKEQSKTEYFNRVSQISKPSFRGLYGSLKKMSFVDMIIEKYSRGNFIKTAGFVGGVDWIKLLDEKNLLMNGYMLNSMLDNASPEDIMYYISLGAHVTDSNFFHQFRSDPDSIRILLSHGLNPDKRENKEPESISFRDYMIRTRNTEILRVLDEPVVRINRRTTGDASGLTDKLKTCMVDLEKCETDKTDIQEQLYDMESELDNVKQLFRRSTRLHKSDIDRLNAIKSDLEGKIVLLNIAVENGTLDRKRLMEEIDILKKEIRVLKGFTESSGEGGGDEPSVPQREDPVSKGYECVKPFRKSNATRRTRLDSCVPAEGGVFDNIRTDEGGRFTNKQKCIEVCHID